MGGCLVVGVWFVVVGWWRIVQLQNGVLVYDSDHKTKAYSTIAI